MSRTALVMFAVTTLVGCTNALGPEDVSAPEAEDVRAEVGDAWHTPGEVSISGAWEEPAGVQAVLRPVLNPPVVAAERVEGPYLSENSSAADGLLAFVNTATVDELDRQIGVSEGAVVGAIVTSRPFSSVSGLQDVAGVTHEVLDGLLQHALLNGYVAGIDHQEMILSVAALAEAGGWDLNQSFGDQLRGMDEAEVERTIGSLPLDMRARFRESNDMDWVALSVTTYAIEGYGVPVGYAFSVVTNDPSVERFGTHYFVEATDEANILVEADFVAD